MAYATPENVKSLCRHIFNQSTGAPSDPEVQDWLDEGAAMIDASLDGAGYSMPVASTAAAYKLLRNLNAFWGAAMAEQSRLVAPVGGEKQTRGEILEDRFYKRLESILKLDLSGQGVTHTSTAYVGGISESEKESVESDTDRIMTRFRSGMHAYPGAGTTGARTPSDSQERSD